MGDEVAWVVLNLVLAGYFRTRGTHNEAYSDTKRDIIRKACVILAICKYKLALNIDF